MRRALKVIAWGAIIAILGFIAILISFGGKHTVSLENTIKSASSLIPTGTQALNLTDTLTDKLSKDIISKNPTGPTESSDGQTINIPSPEKIATETINEQLNSFDPASLIPSIAESALLIVSPTTQKNATIYLTRYFEILRDRLADLKINAAQPDLTDFAHFSQNYKQAMADLAAVKTPDQLIEIQIQTLELLGAQANIFELYSKQDEDPLKALVAAKLQSQIAAEAGELQKKVLSFTVE